MTQRVFISYASRDQSVADSIYDVLKTKGLHPWMATRDVPESTEYASSIVAAIGRSRLLLLILTVSVNSSSQVPLELNLAKSERLPILPVRLQAFDFSPTLQYFLGASQWLDAIAQPW